MKKATLWLVLIGCLLIAWGPKGASARNLYSYDLDSMASLSTEIVEGDVVRHDVAPSGMGLMDVKIGAVYKGKFAAGQTVVVTATGAYCKGTGFLSPTTPLAPGDHLFLFLVRSDPAYLHNVSEDAEIYGPSLPAIKLVQDGRVLSFYQYDNPGPYLAMPPTLNPKAKFPAVQDFPEKIRQSLATDDALRPLLTSPPATADIPRLALLVRERDKGKTGIFIRDAIAETACTKLAALHDYPVLASLLQRTRDRSKSILIGGFGTPTGREYLLKQAADRTLPEAQRLNSAQLLQGAGGVYYAGTNTTMFSEKLQPAGRSANGGYYGRIAFLALENRTNPELSGALISVLEDFARSIENTSENGGTKSGPVWKICGAPLPA